MTSDLNAAGEADWSRSSGLTYLLQVFRIAVHPGKLVLVLGGIFCTLCWGTLLDMAWTRTDHGVHADAVSAYVSASEAASGPTVGVFAALRTFEMACARDAIESIRYGRFIGPVRAGEPAPAPPEGVAGHAVRGAFANVLMMGRGASWLITQHWFFALLFVPVLILIWGFFGGAVCRIAAIKFARDETISVKEAAKYAWRKLFSGFFLAPVIPLGACVAIAIALMVGGLFLSIPWVGDILGGLAFILALLGGLFMALLLVGTVAGGSLFWPTVAVEDSDGFDGAQRGFSYVLGRPLRSMWYAFWLAVMASFGWLLVMFVVWLSAACAHEFVGLGSGVFGDYGSAGNKLSLLWTPPTFESLHTFPAALEGARWVSAGLITLWVMLWWGVSWAFLGSFYFSGSTVAYFLLRRDVDGVELSEVCADEEDGFADLPEQPHEPQAPSDTETPVTEVAASPSPQVDAEPSPQVDAEPSPQVDAEPSPQVDTEPSPPVSTATQEAPAEDPDDKT